MDSSVISWTSSSDSPKLTLLPAERAEASGGTTAAGKLRSARTSSRVVPTAPVAPTMPTLYSPFAAMPTGYGSGRGYFLCFFFLHFFLATDAFLPFFFVFLH